MKRYGKLIKKEWEKALLWCSVLALVAVLCVWLLGLGRSNLQLSSTRGAPRRRSLLNNSAFAFLDAPPAPDLGGNNPFSFTAEKKAKTHRVRPWQRRPTPKTTPKKVDPAPVAVAKPKAKPFKALPKPTPKDVATPKPKPKPKPRIVRIVEYRGTMTTTSGETVALIQTKDPASKKETMLFVKKGGKVDGVQVKDFSAESVEVLDSKGKGRKVRFGEQRKIVLQ